MMIMCYTCIYCYYILFFSGDREAVLCKWFPDMERPAKVSHLGGEIIGITVFPRGKALQFHNNSIKILNDQVQKKKNYKSSN